MTRDDMLARLVSQAGTQGVELVTLRAIVEEASELGAQRALDRLGLDDAQAQKDIDQLRDLVAAWREVKRGVWKTTAEWVVRGVLALLLLGIAMRVGAAELMS